MIYGKVFGGKDPYLKFTPHQTSYPTKVYEVDRRIVQIMRTAVKNVTFVSSARSEKELLDYFKQRKNTTTKDVKKPVLSFKSSMDITKSKSKAKGLDSDLKGINIELNNMKTNYKSEVQKKKPSNAVKKMKRMT